MALHPALVGTALATLDAMSPDRSGDDVVYEDVRVLADSGIALRCILDGRQVWIGKLQVQPGSTIAHAGDRGRLVLKRWMLASLGLKAPDA